MKTRFKRLSKTTVSILLSLLIIVSTVTVGIIATSAAYDNSEAVGDWDTSGKNNLKISFDNGSNYESKNTNSSGYINFEISTTCNSKWEYWADYGGSSRKYLKKNDTNPDSNSISSSTDYYARYVSADNVGTTYQYEASLIAGQYVVQYVDFDSYGSTAGGTLKYHWWRKVAKINAGWNDSGWSKSEMTYNGDGAYKLTVTGTGNQYRFRPEFIDGNESSPTVYRPAGTGTVHSVNLKNVSNFNDYSTKYDAKTSDSDGNANNYFYFDTVSGVQYTIWLKDGGVWLTGTSAETHTLSLSDSSSTYKTANASISPSAGSVNSKADVTVTAYPADGYQAVVTATGGASITGSPITSSGGTATFKMPFNDCAVTVTYQAKPYWPGPDTTGWTTPANYRVMYVKGQTETNLDDITTVCNDTAVSTPNGTGARYYAEITDPAILNTYSGSYDKFLTGISSNGATNGIPADSLSFDYANAPLLNGPGIISQEKNYDGGNRKYARAETKNGYTQGTLTRLGIMFEKTSDGWKIYFYTNNEAPETFDGYYLAGRMTVNGVYTGDAAGKFDATSTNIKFSACDASGDTTGASDLTANYFKLETGMTPAQISTPFDNNTNDPHPQYFIINDKNQLWGDVSNTNDDFYYNKTATLGHSTGRMAYSVITQQKKTECELIFDAVHMDDDSDGKVVIWLDVSGVTDRTAGTGTMKIYYTLKNETTPLAKSVSLTASPSSQLNTDKIRLTASLQESNVGANNCTYTFYETDASGTVTDTLGTVTNSTGRATYDVQGAGEESNGTHYYKVVVTTEQSYTPEGGGESKTYRQISAKTTGTFRDAAVFVTNSDITSNVSSALVTGGWTEITGATYTVTPTMAAGDTYTLSLSDKQQFDSYFAKYNIDMESSKYMDIEYGQKAVTVDGEPMTVRTYVFKTRNYCTNPTITVDKVNHKVYAVATFDKYGGDSKTLNNTTEKVKYYFAKRADKDFNGTNYLDGTKGFNIKYYNNSVTSKTETKWAVPVKADGTTSNNTYSSTSVQCVKGNSDEAKYQIRVDESQLFRNAGDNAGTAKVSSKTWVTYDVYVLEMPIWATSANFCSSNGTTQLGAPILSLNPNRIYVFWSPDDNNDKQWSGIPLDTSFWLSEQTSGAHKRGDTGYDNNQVPTKNFKTNLINYVTGADYGGTINNNLLTAYSTRSITRALYWGMFANSHPSDLDTNWNIALNLAQRNNAQSYYASVWNIVAPELKKDTTNMNPLGGGLLTAYGTNQVMPFFDYNYLKDTPEVGTAYTDKDFPFYTSTYDNVTTYSYDSMVDLNRQYNITGANEGSYTLESPVKLGSNLGYAPFHNQDVTDTAAGFANEYDINFYMTNTGKIQGTNEEHDISFNFSGDDDVWVFVDGVLVLDLGGDHKISAGTINFSDMKVYYKTAAKDFVSDMGTGGTWATESNSVYTMDLQALFNAYGVKFSKTDATTKHRLQMFYMERGRLESNMSLSFNLPQASGLSIKNNVTTQYVNPGLVSAALASASGDYFSYEIKNALASSSLVSAYKEATGTDYANVRNASGSDISGLDFTKPLYPANTNAVRNVYGIEYLLAKLTGTAGTAANGYSTPTSTDYVPVTNVNYLLTDEFLTTEAKDLTGQIKSTSSVTQDAGYLHLLSGQQANFTDKIAANTMVQIRQIPNMGVTKADANGVTQYDYVDKNASGNYYITSYKITEDNINKDLQGQTGYSMLAEYTSGGSTISDELYAVDRHAPGYDASTSKGFYFSSYSPDPDKSNPAMTVEFYNEIAVGDIIVGKEYDKVYSTQGSKFHYTVQFANIFGDTDDFTTLAEYNGLEYYLFNSIDDSPVTNTPQIYDSEVGIVLEAGQYAKITGVPVETRYKVTERPAANHNLVSIEKTATKNDGTALNNSDNFSIDSRTFYNETLNSSSTGTKKTAFDARSTSDDSQYYAADKMTYYVNMIPVIEESILDIDTRSNFESLAAAENTYESVNKIVFTNKKEAFSVTFKFYDRLEQNNTVSQIRSTPSSYTFNLESLSEYTTYFTEATTVGDKTYQKDDFKSYNFEKLIKDYAVEFATDTNIGNIIDNYHMWTTEQAAVTAMRDKTNAKPGGAAYTSSDDIMYHTNYLGQIQTNAEANSERWVTYKAQNGTTLEDPYGFYISDAESKIDPGYADGDITAYDQVKSIVVWCFNEPKQYNVTVHHAEDNDVMTAATGAKGLTGFYKSNNGDTTKMNAYYNQRLGYSKDGYNEAGFFEQYGIPGYTGGMPENCIDLDLTSDDDTQYKFAYWAFDAEGTQVASTEYHYFYRVSNSIALYPIYTLASNPVDVGFGLSALANATDTYVDSNGKSKTRLNVLFNPYGLDDNDPNVLETVVLNIVFSDEQLEALEAKEAGEDAPLVRLFNANKTGLATYLDTNATKANMTGGNKINQNVALGDYSCVDRGFLYTVQGNASDTGAIGNVVVQLTNKNRMQFTSIFNSATLYKEDQVQKILQVTAMKYNDNGTAHWFISDNCIVNRFAG